MSNLDTNEDRAPEEVRKYPKGGEKNQTSPEISIIFLIGEKIPFLGKNCFSV